jgi:hypothetical protein
LMTVRSLSFTKTREVVQTKHITYVSVDVKIGWLHFMSNMWKGLGDLFHSEFLFIKFSERISYQVDDHISQIINMHMSD